MSQRLGQCARRESRLPSAATTFLALIAVKDEGTFVVDENALPFGGPVFDECFAGLDVVPIKPVIVDRLDAARNGHLPERFRFQAFG